jgi:hypothetical protein
LLFLLRCKHLFTPSNFTSAACLFATSEARLYRSYIGFFRTDIPSSQYRVIQHPDIHPDLTGADLSGIQLTGVYLSNTV